MNRKEKARQCRAELSVFRPGFVKGYPHLMLEASAEAVVAFVLPPFMGDGGTLDGEISGAVGMKFLEAGLLGFRQLFQGVGPETIQGGDLIQRRKIRYPGGGNIQIQHFLAVGQG